jgi:Tfp pilus assembly protein PilF
MNFSLNRFPLDFVCPRGTHIAITLLLLLASSAAASAQGVGSSRGLPDSGGNHMIQGRVYLPSGQSAAQGILVKLEGNVVGSRRGGTDQDGSFIFNSLPAGEFTISVDAGPEYEVSRQSVVIYGAGGGFGGSTTSQKLFVDFHLMPKGSAANEEKLFAGVPKEAVENYKKGVQSARAGDTKKAVEQLNAALAIHPKFAPALSELGVQYLKLKEMGKVAASMEELLKLTPNDYHAHVNLGIALYNQKKFADAETHLREAIRLTSTDPVGHYYLGLTLVSIKNYAEAETELELTIKNGGDNLALAHKYLGGLYLSSGKSRQAADELEKYLKLDPKAADAERIKTTIKDLRSKQ